MLDYCIFFVDSFCCEIKWQTLLDLSYICVTTCSSCCLVNDMEFGKLLLVDGGRIVKVSLLDDLQFFLLLLLDYRHIFLFLGGFAFYLGYFGSFSDYLVSCPSPKSNAAKYVDSLGSR